VGSSPTLATKLTVLGSQSGNAMVLHTIMREFDSLTEYQTACGVSGVRVCLKNRRCPFDSELADHADLILMAGTLFCTQGVWVQILQSAPCFCRSKVGQALDKG
jgi:hypothetical protein